jgi:copper(I)-binding protein
MRAALLLTALTLAACTGDEGSWRSPNGEITVSRVFAPAPANVGSPDSATMAVYATLANVSAMDDTLTGVSTSLAGSASIHTTMTHGASQMMHATDHVVVPANGITRLAPGGTHIMLERLSRAFVPGDTLPLTLTFRRGGTVAVNASVLSYDKLQQALER